MLATAWGGTLYAWDSFQIIGPVRCCASWLALVFVQVERRAKEPIIPLLLFKNKNFVLCTTTGLIIMLGMMGTMSYLPTYFQIVDQLSPEQAGLMTVPMMAGVMITAIGTGFFGHEDRPLQVDAHRVLPGHGRGRFCCCRAWPWERRFW